MNKLGLHIQRLTSDFWTLSGTGKKIAKGDV